MKTREGSFLSQFEELDLGDYLEALFKTLDKSLENPDKFIVYKPVTPMSFE